MRRRLAAILTADVVGYSGMMEADQAATIAHVRQLYEQCLEPSVSTHGGMILKRMGDGWIVGFDAATHAVECARVLQNQLGQNSAIKIRAAIHIGEYVDDGEDLYGTCLNIAARLQSEAPPGGFMISEETRRQLDRALVAEFSEAGTFELKNISYPVQAHQWRPKFRRSDNRDEIPVIGVERTRVSPESAELRELADEFHEQMIYRLSRRTGIQVSSATKGANPAPTYRFQSRLSLRNSAQLVASMVRVRTGQVFWSNRFEDRPDRLYELVTQAAQVCDEDLRTEINARDAERLTDLPDDALNPSELRARAAQNFYRGTIKGYLKAIEVLDRCLSLSPSDPMAQAMWSHARLRLIRCGAQPPEPEILERMVQLSNIAIENAPRSDFVCKVRSEVMINVLSDFAGARRNNARIMALNPDYHLRFEVEAELALAEGNYAAVEEVLVPYFRSFKSDMDRPYICFLAALAAMLDGRFETALEHIDTSIELRSTCRIFLALKAEIFRRAGRSDAAGKMVPRIAELGHHPDILAVTPILPEEDREILDRLAMAPLIADRTAGG